MNEIIANVFQPQMREDWSHEILFALRAILFKLSIWDHNASYGAALQDLRYIDNRSKGPVHSAPTKWQKSLYGLLTVGGRYAWDKWESWLVGQEGGYEEVSVSGSVSRLILTMAAVKGSTDAWSSNGLRIYGAFHRCFRLVSGFLGQRPVSDAGRPDPAYASLSALRAGQSRSLV